MSSALGKKVVQCDFRPGSSDYTPNFTLQKILGSMPNKVAESEVFGWSRIPKNTKSRIFYPTPTVKLNQLLHRTSKLGIQTRAC